MTNAVITWFQHEFGTLKTKVLAIEPEILAWAETFLADITPVIKQAAEDAVLAAVTAPGDGNAKFAFAVGTAIKDLTTQGVPVVENNIKAAVQIAYKALPPEVTNNTAAQAVVDKVDGEIDRAATKAEADTSAPSTEVAAPTA